MTISGRTSRNIAGGRKNLDLWARYGDYVLMAMPYADNVLVEAQGCRLRDADGNELLDLASGMFCCVLGHNHPAFIERVKRQTERLLHTGTQFLSPSVLEASYALAQVTPGSLRKSVFLSTGTEANEFAFRVARAYTGRTGIVGLSRGYYGTSLATRSCSGLFSHGDSAPAAGSFRLPITKDCEACFSRAEGSMCPFPCLHSAQDWIGDWSNIAAVIVEPVLSAGGMLFPPPGYLKSLRNLAHAEGALFIVDEAQTGFGRTGEWFAIQHHDAEPDILSLSKSVGNGFPVAAVSVTAAIANKVIGDGFWNLSSHQSDPVAAAAVHAVIDIVREEGLIDRARESGAYFLDLLQDLSSRLSIIGNVRGQGLMIAFDLVPESGEVADMAMAFMYGCRHRGVHLTYGYGNRNIRIIPPLIISREEIEFAVQVIESSLKDLIEQTDLKRYWPNNPQTRRLLEQHPFQQFVSRLWRSSPEVWLEKGSRLIQKRLGK